MNFLSGSHDFVQSDLDRLAQSPLARAIGQAMWPPGSVYQKLPQPVAVEASGWFAAFHEFLAKAPPIEEAIAPSMNNPLASIVSSIAKPLYERLTASDNLLAICDALGMPGWRMHLGTSLYAMHRAFRARNGAIIETTEALDGMLGHADIAADLPASMFAAPFVATYVHFSGRGLEIVLPPASGCREARVVGVYVLANDGIAHLGEEGDPFKGEILNFETAEHWSVAEGDPFKKLEFLIVVDQTDDDGEAFRRFAATEFVVSLNTQEPVLNFIRGRRKVGGDADWLADALIITVEHLAKVFLYMGLTDARKTLLPDADLESARIAGLGQKKRAKAERKLKEKYNRIVVGPAGWNSGTEISGSGERSVSPHMRRGHFRMQRHGPRNELKRIVFIQPMLVRPDRAIDSIVLPKQYIVSVRGGDRVGRQEN
mgnify:CR=1 FL=1|jgi:hypothetical protein